MRRVDFHYQLPPELIAQQPAAERAASRLLYLDGASGALRDMQFRQLRQLLRAGDLLVFNDTRVLPARVFARKASGGRVEIMLERRLDATTVLAQCRASKALTAGMVLALPGGYSATLLPRQGELYALKFSGDVDEFFEAHGEMPLPPYIDRPATASDRERYQTVFARAPGAVAAPTAGLHFDAATLAEIKAAGVATAFVTLHIGAGTFAPIRVDDLSQHRMHSETVSVPAATCEAIRAARAAGGRVIAVGTTVVRSLETAAQNGALRPYSGETQLFIQPGYEFRSVDALFTNFHLPESSLLILVSAFAGREAVLGAYAHAVAAQYRFFSYGDAMFLTPRSIV